MTGAELKTLRESLSLSAQALAEILHWKGLMKAPQDRTIRRWEDGVNPIPDQVGGCIRALDAEVEDMAWRGIEAIEEAIERGQSPRVATFLRYESAEDYRAAYRDLGGQPHPHKTHAAGLARLLHYANDEVPGVQVRLVSFDREKYEAWRFQEGMEDGPQTRAMWAGLQIRRDV